MGESVDEVRAGPDREVEVERVVLAEGEALEAIDDQRLGEGATGPEFIEQQQGVAAEPCGLAHDASCGSPKRPGFPVDSLPVKKFKDK